MQRTLRCQSCGSEAPQDAVYCPNCGSRISSNTRHAEWNWQWNQPEHRRRETDWWGLVTAAGFLVIIALTFAAYPDVFTRIGNYLVSFGKYGYPVLPSYNLGQVVIYFLNLAGIWGLVAAALRFFLTGSGSRAARDGVGALFSLYTADLLTQFYAGAFRGSGLIGLWLVGLFTVIVADALIILFVPRRVSFYSRGTPREISVE